MSGASGWNYDAPNTGGKDARKIVTLRDAHGMTWVGIRAWHSRERYWLNGSDPETARVIAWRDLPDPAPGRWSHGQLVGDSALDAPDSAASPTGGEG